MSLLQRNRNYRLLFIASAVSQLGSGVSKLAMPWMATLLTRDAVLISMVAAAGGLPWLLFTIPAGVVTDRSNRQTMMVQADVVRMGLTIGLVALAVGYSATRSDNLLIYLLIVISFLFGVAKVFRDNAAQTALPNIVEKSDLETANGQMWSMSEIMGQFIGPPLAGILIAVALPLPFVLDGATFGIAAWLVWRIAFPARRHPRGDGNFREQMVEGIRWLTGHKTILRLAVMLSAMNMLGTMWRTLLVLFAQEILLLSATGFGLLLMAGAAGGVIGGYIAPKIIARIGQSNSLRTALLLFALEPLVIYVFHSITSTAIVLFVGMIASMLWNVVTVSLRQRVIPENLLGRVNSLYRFFGWGAMPVGAMLGGIIVSAYETSLGREAALQLPFLVAAAGAGVLAVYGISRKGLGGD
jgi:MFS family permease